jgi:hypothetical protein
MKARDFLNLTAALIAGSLLGTFGRVGGLALFGSRLGVDWLALVVIQALGCFIMGWALELQRRDRYRLYAVVSESADANTDHLYRSHS